MSNSDYGLKITIHDLAGAVRDAVDRAHGEYEPKFYDWMKQQIESYVEHVLDTDNAKTEQVLGVNEVEEMIDNSLSEHDFTMTIEDIISYNYDFVTECDVSDIVRDYCDGEEFLTADMVCDVTEFDARVNECEAGVRRLEAQVMSMQAELDFLHEKHVENVERRLTERIRRAIKAVCSVPGQVWARVPRFTIVRKAN